MITLFVIGILILSIKLVLFAVKAAWGITKAVLFIVGIPVILVGLLIAGLASLAGPLLIIALIVIFLVSRKKGL